MNTKLYDVIEIVAMVTGATIVILSFFLIFYEYCVFGIFGYCNDKFNNSVIVIILIINFFHTLFWLSISRHLKNQEIIIEKLSEK